LLLFGTNQPMPVDIAANRYHEGLAPLIIVTGGVNRHNGIIEGRAFQQLLHDRGVPEEAIRVEDRSANTWQNVELATPYLREAMRCSTSAPSIFGQGETWKAYAESMPTNCDKSNAGEYAVRHNPPPYYTSLSGCATNDVPYTQLASDLANNTLPAFSFITPNLIDDMHDGTVADGDTWLANNLPAIFNSTAYQSGTTAVFLTWDEGEGGSSNDCATNTTDIGCHVATIVASPSTVPGTTSATLFNHYSLLGTAEQLLGLPALGTRPRSRR
jgi:hypothetical protein